MTAERIDGKAVAAQIKDELKVRVDALRAKGVVPGLGTVLVGADPGSQIYVGGKHKDCAQVGIESIRVDLPEDTTLIDPDKDADGLAPASLGKLVLTEPGPLPCTPRGIVELLNRYEVPLSGAEVCVVGRGTTVGRPLGLLLTRKSENATVTLCHTGTKDLAAHTREADIVIAAVGRAGFLTADMVKPGAVVIDVGVSRVDGKPVGDVAADVWEVASKVTPNPGGVGPMTRAMLLSNVVDRAEQTAEQS